MPADLPRKHHYLPQFYLKGFTGVNETLFQLAKETSKAVPVSIKDAATERDFHRLDVQGADADQFAAEKLIASVEGHYAEILRAVLQEPHNFDRHRVELIGLSQFMFYRVPKVRDMVASSTEASLVASFKLMDKHGKFPEMPESLKRHLAGRSIAEVFKPKVKNWFIIMHMLRLSIDLELYAILHEMNLSILQASGPCPFIFGDAAVALYDESYSGVPGSVGGFISPSAELSFPLSSRLLLHMGRSIRPGIFAISDSQVRGFNRRAIVWSERFLFGEMFDEQSLSDAALLATRRAGFSAQNIEASDGIYTIRSMTPVHPALIT